MKSYIFSLLFLISITALSQQSYIIVNEDSISLKEFKKEYHDNIEFEGLEQAVNTYIDFKLLQQEAAKTQVDTTAAFKRIYEQSIQSERDPYLYNAGVKEALINEIWQNLQTDKKVEVYALGLSNPFDLKAKNERKQLAQDLYNSVCKNQKATQEVKEFRQSLKNNSQWMRPMTTSAEIERSIYATKLGACSPIQQAEQGFYFVKVIDERPSTGNIFLSFIFNPEEKSIQKAYSELSEGQNWKDVARKYQSLNIQLGFPQKENWGERIPAAFLEVIKNLKPGEISKPFEAKDGFYVLKFHQQEKFDQLSDWKNWIDERIPQTSYAMDYVQYVEQLSDSLIEVKENKKALNALLKAVGQDLFATKDSITFNDNQTIWSSSTSPTIFTQQELLQELNITRNYLTDKTDMDSFLAYFLPNLKTKFRVNSYIKHLENYETEFAKTSKLLKKAIRVNHYIENEIYYKAEQDTLGLKNYLKQHKADYTWPVRYELEIYRYKQSKDAKIITKMLENNKNSDEILSHFESKKDNNGVMSVYLSKGKFALDGPTTPPNFNPKKKVQTSTYQNSPAVIKVVQRLESRPKTFDEAKRQLTEDYKTYYYTTTLKNLRKNATISLPSTL